MGIFDFIFKKPQPVGHYEGMFQMLNGYQPSFTSFAGGVYESELVRAAIDARARHISKLNVSILGSAKPSLAVRLKHGPNEFQTWGQFLYRLSTILDVQNTAVIVPVMDQYGEVTGIYPVLASLCEVVQYNKKPWLRFQFNNGQTAAREMDKCGIMTKFQYKSDFFGENNGALMPLMELMNIQNQGIQEGVKSAATYRFMAQYNNFANEADLKKESKRFTETNLREGGGVLLFPNTYKDIKQIDSKPFVVDAAQMKVIETKVFDYFGVNEDVLQNKAYGDSWSAFYEGCCEWFAIQFSDVVTKMLYTMKERSQGSGIMATSNRLQYMSTTDKLNVSSQLSDRGILNRDEVREIWNLPPLPNDEGKAYIIRGEYYNADEKINEGKEDGKGN